MTAKVRFDLLHMLWAMLTFISSDPKARKQFNMETWLARTFKGNVTHTTSLRNFDPNDCRSVGCAIGWGAVCYPEIANGLNMDRFLSRDRSLLRDQLLAELLGITRHECLWLFFPGAYSEPFVAERIPPAAVAKRIKQVIDKYATLHVANLIEDERIEAHLRRLQTA